MNLERRLLLMERTVSKFGRAATKAEFRSFKEKFLADGHSALSKRHPFDVKLEGKVRRMEGIVSGVGLSGTLAELMRFRTMVEADGTYWYNESWYDIRAKGIPALRAALSKECKYTMARLDSVAKEAEKNNSLPEHITTHLVAEVGNNGIHIREASCEESSKIHFYARLGLGVRIRVRHGFPLPPERVRLFELPGLAHKVRDAERKLNGILDRMEKEVETKLHWVSANRYTNDGGNGRIPGM
jgi:hypothetical protein